MNSLTKGSLAMVLAGSVTFSLANALFIDHSSTRVLKEKPLAISRDLKSEDVSLGEKKTKIQGPTASEKHGQTNPSRGHLISNTVSNSSNKTGNDVAIQQNTKISNENTTTNPKNGEKPTTKPLAVKKTVIETVEKPQKVMTSTMPPRTNTTSKTTSPNTNPAPVTSNKETTETTIQTPTNPGKTSQTTSVNHGQQIAQDAKEKAVSHRKQKEDSGKKM